MMDADQVIGVLEKDLSITSRVRAVLVGLAGSAMAALIVLLWSTEPEPLPSRTAVLFGAMTAIGVAWAGYGVWVVTRRRPLYARDSVIAGRMATIFAAAFALGAPVIAAGRGSAAPALAVGMALVAAAATAWTMAVRRRRRLLSIRAELERSL